MSGRLMFWAETCQHCIHSTQTALSQSGENQSESPVFSEELGLRRAGWLRRLGSSVPASGSRLAHLWRPFRSIAPGNSGTSKKLSQLSRQASTARTASSWADFRSKHVQRPALLVGRSRVRDHAPNDQNATFQHRVERRMINENARLQKPKRQNTTGMNDKRHIVVTTGASACGAGCFQGAGPVVPVSQIAIRRG